MEYQRYKRGTLVMVDFSPSKGSELSGKHLAISITKKDSPRNAVLTVIPLSSKEKPYYLDLGYFLMEQIIPVLERHQSIQMLDNQLVYKKIEFIRENTQQNKFPTENINSDLLRIEENHEKFSNVLRTYEKMNKNSFALVQNITTVSKLRILKPINKFDPILNLQVSDEILNKLDQKILELFIGETKS